MLQVNVGQKRLPIICYAVCLWEMLNRKVALHNMWSVYGKIL